METKIEKPNESCQELKNIKYKNMLLNGGKIEEDTLENSKITSIDKLEMFLENTNTTKPDEPWSKLDKTNKIVKCLEFAERYALKHELNDDNKSKLIDFLTQAIDKKKIQRVKDVNYDKSTGEVKDIIGLQFNKTTKKYTIRNNDKRISTLKSLPPKKTKKIKPQVSNETDNKNLADI
jgi:hypothetical protein